MVQRTVVSGWQAFGRQPIPPLPPDTPPPAKNGPDPSLFPFLARRLAGSPPPEPGADEYLAAATVLAMKYGPAVLDQVGARASSRHGGCFVSEQSSTRLSGLVFQIWKKRSCF